jgi:hypothetical protein
MSEILNSKIFWTLITIDDAPKFLSGKTIWDFLNLIKQKTSLQFIVLDALEGVGRNGLIAELQKKSNLVIDIDDFMKILPEIKTFEWCDLFVFKKFPENWTNSGKEPYPSVIVQSDMTIRAVDNQYLYIYTPSKQLVDLISENYHIESIKNAPLNELDYPE